MQKFTIQNADGQETHVFAPYQHQHIWNRATLPVSGKVAARVRRDLGEGPLYLVNRYSGTSAVVEFGKCSECGA